MISRLWITATLEPRSRSIQRSQCINDQSESGSRAGDMPPQPLCLASRNLAAFCARVMMSEPDAGGFNRRVNDQPESGSERNPSR